MDWLKKIVLTRIQTFVGRSDQTHIPLRSSEALAAAGIGYEVSHSGRAMPLVMALPAGVALAQAIAMGERQKEIARHG